MTVVTGRTYKIRFDTPIRVDPSRFSIGELAAMLPSDFVRIQANYLQTQDHFKINGQRLGFQQNASAVLNASAIHGAYYYNKTRAPSGWWWGNTTYRDTAVTVVIRGDSDRTLEVEASEECSGTPEECSQLSVVSDVREGMLLWSDEATWANRTGGVPAADSKVLIPQGWTLVLDTSPPPLNELVVQGTLVFDNRTDVTLTASYIIVMGRGKLEAGREGAPHAAAARIVLSGTRETPNWATNTSLVMGSKVCVEWVRRGGGKPKAPHRPVQCTHCRMRYFAFGCMSNCYERSIGGRWAVVDASNALVCYPLESYWKPLMKYA